jgi:hypothetical protein
MLALAERGVRSAGLACESYGLGSFFDGEHRWAVPLREACVPLCAGYAQARGTEPVQPVTTR